nr:hypothetical protein [uncultured Carboxylicivirga sp.]
MLKCINQINKSFKLLILIVFVVGVSSCTTSKSFVSDSANLEKYNYATITNVTDYGGSATLMNIEVEIYDALTKTRLNVIGDNEISTLSESQKGELLLVRFSASQSDEESVVSINFTDFITGKPIASCRGAYAMGWSRENDLRVAKERAFEQMKTIFK